MADADGPIKYALFYGLFTFFVNLGINFWLQNLFIAKNALVRLMLVTKMEVIIQRGKDTDHDGDKDTPTKTVIQFDVEYLVGPHPETETGKLQREKAEKKKKEAASMMGGGGMMAGGGMMEGMMDDGASGIIGLMEIDSQFATDNDLVQEPKTARGMQLMELLKMVRVTKDEIGGCNEALSTYVAQLIRSAESGGEDGLVYTVVKTTNSDPGWAHDNWDARRDINDSVPCVCAVTTHKHLCMQEELQWTRAYLPSITKGMWGFTKDNIALDLAHADNYRLKMVLGIVGAIAWVGVSIYLYEMFLHPPAWGFLFAGMLGGFLVVWGIPLKKLLIGYEPSGQSGDDSVATWLIGLQTHMHRSILQKQVKDQMAQMQKDMMAANGGQNPMMVGNGAQTAQMMAAQ